MGQKVQTLDTSDGPLHFTVVHRPRVTRRLHLELDECGDLVAVVPRDWPLFYLRRVLNRNLGKVRRFLETERARKLEPLRFEDGALHWFRGEQLAMRIRPGSPGRGGVSVENHQLQVTGAHLSPDQIRRRLEYWYREQAWDRFTERLELFTDQLPWARDRKPSLALRRMKRTWGTCNSKAVIRLNTHLIKAPDPCLDYVVVHELCHLQEMNHGQRFVALQDRWMPDWKTHRQHLRQHGHRYTQQ